MDDRILAYNVAVFNMVRKSLGLPVIDRELSAPPSPSSIDEENEELYTRDDLREFHVPVTQVRDGFYTIMAKSAADAETSANVRLELARNVDLQENFTRFEVGRALEA